VTHPFFQEQPHGPDPKFQDDPFWGDPEYPAMIRMRHDETGEIQHAVLISNIGPVHFVWIIEQKKFDIFDMAWPDQTPVDPQLPAFGSPFPEHFVEDGMPHDGDAPMPPNLGHSEGYRPSYSPMFCAQCEERLTKEEVMSGLEMCFSCYCQEQG